MKIIKFILRRPVGTLMLCIGLSLGGIWAGFNMRLDFLPDFSVPKLTIIAPYRGLPSDEVRGMITIPLEDALSSAGGLKNMKSISRDGLALIELEFPWGTDRTLTGIRCREIIDYAYISLPSDAPKPQVLAADPGDIPIITLAVYPKNGDLSCARRIADKELRSRLQRIEGVGSIQISGGTEQEIHIDVDPRLLAGRGFTLSELSGLLESSNIDYPAGTLTEGDLEYIVKTKAQVQNTTDLENIYLPAGEGMSSYRLQLKDVAQVSYGTRRQTSYFYSWSEERGGEEGIRLMIRRRSGFSPRGMAQNIKTELEEIKRSFGRDLDIVLLVDRSTALDRSLENLITSLLLGAVIAFLVLLIFMRSFTQSLILIFTLTSSLLWAIMLLFLLGKSLNLMSLGGLALAVGMVVDNSIIVTERFARIIRISDSRKQRVETLSKIICSLSPSVAGSTITTIIVFTPLLFIKGLAGSLFGDLGLSVLLALASSLILSLTAVPVLYLLFNPSVKEGGGKLFSVLRKILKLSLRRSAASALVIIIIGAAGIYFGSRLPREVIAPLNEGKINAVIQMPPGTSLRAAGNLASTIANELSELEGIDRIFCWAGGESDDPYYLSSTGESTETIQIKLLIPPEMNSETFKALILEKIQPSGCKLSILPPENILENLLGIKSAEDWVITAGKPEIARNEAARLIEQIKKSVGSNDLPELLPLSEKSLLRIYPDREALSAADIDLPSLSRQVGEALYGSLPTTMRDEGRNIDVRMRVREEDRKTRIDIMNLTLPTNGEEIVRIDRLASLEEEEALPYLLRENRKDLGVIHFASKARQQTARLLRESGASPRELPEILKESDELITVFILALLLLYLCLGIQFESFSLPAFLMLSIPPGGAGITTALLLSGNSINLNSSLGLLVIMGISVNNGILLFEEGSAMLARTGSTPLGALYKGTASRLRPIILTSLTTVTALIPLAIDPHGSSSQASLAAAVIGGLCISTILSLLLLPQILLPQLKKRKGMQNVN